MSKWLCTQCGGNLHGKGILREGKGKWIHSLPADCIAELRQTNKALYEALDGAQEELRLLRMKDTTVVYDPSAALAKARGESK